MLDPLAYWAILSGVVVLAFVRGHIDERIAAVTCLIGTLATLAVSTDISTKYTTVEDGVLIVDLIAFLIFTGVALHSARFWPLWVAGFQLVSTLAHLMRAIHPTLIPHVYAAAEKFWIYPIFAAILIGIWRCPRYAALEEPA